MGHRGSAISNINYFRKRENAQNELKRIFELEDITLIIHYSCESFYKKGKTFSPRIASISVKHLRNGCVTSFSIHQYAEKAGIEYSDIPLKYEQIERKLLQDFFNFVHEHKGFKWLHWNMRSLHFGFQALEHRFEVLGGKPVKISEENKSDLSAILISIYGPKYAAKPVLVNLCKMNNLHSDLFLPGANEAEVFDNGEFRKLHQSTYKKVDFISYIAEMALNDTLVTKTKWWHVYFAHPSVFVDLIQEHWVFGLLVILTTIATFFALI